MFTALQALLNSLAVTFDLPILDWIQAHLQCTFLDVTMPIVTLFGDGGVFWIAVAVVLLLFAKYRKTGFSMGMALVLGLLVCNRWPGSAPTIASSRNTGGRSPCLSRA